ncbi:DNA helicase PcrA [Phascolarctobacterium sp. ET69]|uniref:DNA helicase PcrA n=1 Tax=Phascolarctobacterium sp. ET69 TaxID=2939420 RepID=UPI002011B487|nr:DNA helicase PcrA [Phascolarctobacterium sp. ET69]MCL1605140.1 DNA helicase PcrA [Phascolarctobacterium sp. ET69]
MTVDCTYGLNPQQAEAVINTEGPMLIMAGAGSGKTKVLTCRVANLLQKGVRPYRILAITFTNKAAAEMRERVNNMSGPAAKDVWLFTFHAFCARFLRMEIDKLPGYGGNFAIYDTADSQNLIKQILKEMNLDDKRFQPSGILSRISNAKNALQDAASFARQAGDFYEQKVADIYSRYEQKLQLNNALDFDDLLMLSIKLLQENKEVREKYQDRFDYLLVDEYQDTNHAQYLLTKFLAAKHRNICVVGDADQSIYGWRGADIQNILDFEKDYPDAKVIKLEQNYRSTQIILDAANAVIENNTGRKPKNLWTENKSGADIIYFQAVDERDEARFVIEQLQNLQRTENKKLGDMVILYRTNTQSRIFEEMLIKSGISYNMVGGLKFYERKEIKDIIAYLRVIFNPADSLSLLRIINVPKRGIGDASLAKIQAYAAANNVSLFEAVSNAAAIDGLSSRFVSKLDDLAGIIFELMNLANEAPVEDLIDRVLRDTGYLEELENERTPQAQSRIDNLHELISVAQEFAASEEENNLENFLAHVALVSDIDDTELGEDAITLMTLHSSKGLEFPVVFLVGMEEGLFPHARTLMDETEIEEERRLCYVGITRAKEKLFLSSTKMRTIYGNTVTYPPSRFLQEIPARLVKTIKRQERFSALENFKQVSEKYSARPQKPASTFNPHSFMPQKPAAAAGGTGTRFNTGDRVSHSKWGEGMVVSVKDSPDGQEVKVAFAGAGVRSLLTKYAVLKKL